MNGNELNNMAQHYKEEMMRLYRKSGATASQSSVTDTPATRNMEGTPVGENAQFFEERKHQPVHAPQQQTVPVSCECRFPTAESLIGSAANTPVTLPLTPEDYEHGSGHASAVMPRSASSQNASEAHSGTGAELRSIMLNNSPESGSYVMPSDSETEAEILPDFALPEDAAADSSKTVPFVGEHAPSPNWINITGDNSWGYLQFEVFTAGGSYPVPGAVITVKKQLPSGTGLARVLFSNRSGQTSTIALPAPASLHSFKPNSSYRPFSEYTVTVRARGYYTLRDINIPIFAGVKTVQPIDLVPLPENSVNTPIQPRNDGSTVG